MWNCNICEKIGVKDKGKGFRVFIEYEQQVKMDLTLVAKCTHQIRICDKCLKKQYQTIII